MSYHILIIKLLSAILSTALDIKEKIDCRTYAYEKERNLLSDANKFIKQ